MPKWRPSRRSHALEGTHVYKEWWETAIGEELECQRERGNAVDAYAIASSDARNWPLTSKNQSYFFVASAIAWAGIEEDSNLLESGRLWIGFKQRIQQIHFNRICTQSCKFDIHFLFVIVGSWWQFFNGENFPIYCSHHNSLWGTCNSTKVANVSSVVF